MKKSTPIVITFAIVLLVPALILAVLFIAGQHQAVHTVVHVETAPNNSYGRTLRVVGDQDYDPYTFLDPDGSICGHDVELVYTLAGRMQYNTDIALLPWREAIDPAANGGADLVLTMAYVPDAYPGYTLSIPLTNDPFVAFGSAPFAQVGELYGKRLAVLTSTGCIPGFIQPYQLTDNTVEYATISEVFQAVLGGRADYAIVRYSVGRRAMANLPKGSVTAVGPTLLDNYVCIGVPAAKGELLTELNNAIVSVSTDGTLTALSEKWLGHYVDTLTFREYLAANIDTLLYAIGALMLVFLIGILFISRSLSRKKETLLKKLAERDQLTGLYNRATCENIIRETLNSSDPTANVHALLVIDMDNFKKINDTFGHMEGDAALVRLATGLNKLFRAGDVIGRLGGDEFFVFMTDCTSAEAPRQKAMKIGELFANTYSINDNTVHISASVGVALYPRQGANFTALYKSADDALYAAKRLGKGGFAMLNEAGQMTYSGSGKKIDAPQ